MGPSTLPSTTTRSASTAAATWALRDIMREVQCSSPSICPLTSTKPSAVTLPTIFSPSAMTVPRCLDPNMIPSFANTPNLGHSTKDNHETCGDASPCVDPLTRGNGSYVSVHLAAFYTSLLTEVFWGGTRAGALSALVSVVIFKRDAGCSRSAG